MKTWYHAVVKSQKQNDEGALVTKNTELLLEAVSYSDAETRINAIAEQAGFEHQGDFSISKISKSSITDVPFFCLGLVCVATKQEADLAEAPENVFDDDLNWRIKTEHETLLINAATALEAAERVEQMYRGTAVQPNISNVQKTKIENVFRLED